MNDEITLNKSEVELLVELLDLVKLPFHAWNKYDNVMSKIYGVECNDE